MKDLPINLDSFPSERLDFLKIQCLEMASGAIRSRSFQSNIARLFATGDTTILTNDQFSPIVEKLLTLESPDEDVSNLVQSALDGLLSALPLQFITTILDTFVKTQKGVRANMLTIASDIVAKASSSDLSLRASITQLLALLTNILEQDDDLKAKTIALRCIRVLSRVHGKAELPLFESALSIIVDKGVGSENVDLIEHSLDALLSMLYQFLKSLSYCSPVLDARILPFLPELMRVIWIWLPQAKGNTILMYAEM
jgi:hypothetical protein